MSDDYPGSILQAWKLSLTMNLKVFLLAGLMVASPASAQYEPVTIVGENAVHGVFDPSLEYAPSGDTGWMSYSPVEMPRVHTGIARSADHGQTWEHVMRVNQCIDDTIIHQSIPVPGIWRHEVSTLVYDPDDQGREWKLYWHRYFTRPPYQEEDRLFAYGWIAYKYAPHPAGPWSEEKALFGAYPYPLGDYPVETYLNQLHPDLADIVAFTEPGSLYKDGILYLTFNGFTEDGSEGTRIILISSHDHGQSWEYTATLTDHADAAHLGYEYFTASSLVQVSGRFYLLVSPWGEEPVNHDGTYVLEFEDLELGNLKRDAGDNLVVIDYLPPSVQGWTNAGESDYDQHNTAGGIVMPQTDTSQTEVFRIYNTHRLLTGIDERAGDGEDSEVSLISGIHWQKAIRYHVPESGRVSLVIYDVLGKEVSTLVNGMQASGKHRINVDGLASGVYFCRLRACGQVRTSKFVVIE